MTLKELKNWVLSLPEEFDEFIIINGEGGVFEDDPEFTYRVDKPVTFAVVDEKTKEVVLGNDANIPYTIPKENPLNKLEDEHN